MATSKKVELLRVDVPTEETKQRTFDVRILPFLIQYDVQVKGHEEGLSYNQCNIFLNRWDALFEDLNYDMANRYDDKGNFLYPANRVKKDGQFFYLTKVKAEFTRNREHTVDVTLEYIPDNKEEADAPFTIKKKSETKYGMHPLYNYHFSAERSDYIEYTEKGIFYMARTYTIVPTK